MNSKINRIISAVLTVSVLAVLSIVRSPLARAANTFAITSPSSTTSIYDGSLTVTGTSDNNAIIDVKVDGQVVGTVTADGTGHWTDAIPHVAAGNHAISEQVKINRQFGYMTNRGFGTIDVVDVTSKSYVHEISGPDTYFATIFVTAWVVLFPKSTLAWRAFKGLPTPPAELASEIGA